MSQSGDFTLELDQAALNLNQEFVVSVFVSSPDQPANTVFAKINYDSSQLSFLDTNFSTSVFPNVVERQSAANQIRLTSFTTNAFSGNHGLFTRLRFKALQNGQSVITLAADSKIHADDGLATNLADPAKLPVQLTVSVGESKQEAIIQQGASTPSPANISPLSDIQPIDAYEQPDAQSSDQTTATSIADNFSESGVNDFSTFSASPKILPPPQPPAATGLGSTPIIFAAITLLTIVSVLLIMKFRRKKDDL